MTGRQLGDERARYGRKSAGERLDDLWESINRYRLWVVGAALVIAIGAWFAVMSRNVTVDRLAVGDCLYIPTAAAGDPTTTAPIGLPNDVERALFAGAAQEAGCTSSHGHEVSAIFPLASKQVVPNAYRIDLDPACAAAFQPYVGHAASGSAFVTFLVVPTTEQWDAGMRVGICLIARADGQWMGSPARGSGG